MFRIHLKMGPQRNQLHGTTAAANNNNGNSAATTSSNIRHLKEFTCCFGLHVHTATLMIGLWHLVSKTTNKNDSLMPVPLDL